MHNIGLSARDSQPSYPQGVDNFMQMLDSQQNIHPREFFHNVENHLFCGKPSGGGRFPLFNTVSIYEKTVVFCKGTAINLLKLNVE